MKERPILFAAPMVRAILAGTKTQTRRLLKVEYGRGGTPIARLPRTSSFVYVDDAMGLAWRPAGGDPLTPWPAERMGEACPYGAPGDRLWVRETWAIPEGSDAPLDVAYRADIPPAAESDERWAKRNMIGSAKWRPSIHMLRAFSRITLEVTGVRVERLQAISEEDAIAEGITGPHHVGYPAFRVPEDSKPRYSTARAAFEHLWNGINGERAPWSSSPWVWVVSFRRVQP